MLNDNQQTLGLQLSKTISSKKWLAVAKVLTKELLFSRHSILKEIVSNHVYKIPSLCHRQELNIYKQQICEIFSGNNLQIESKETECSECTAIAKSSLLKPLVLHHTLYTGFFGESVILLAVDINPTNDMRRPNMHRQIKALCALNENTKLNLHTRLLAYQCKIKPYFYIVETCNNGKNLSEYLLDQENYFPGLSLTKLCKITLFVISSILYCNAQRVLVRNITAASFVIFENDLVKLLPTHNVVYIPAHKDLEYYGKH